MSRSGDFRGDNGQTDRRTDGQTDRQTDYFTPAHARGVINTPAQGESEEFYSFDAEFNSHSSDSLAVAAQCGIGIGHTPVLHHTALLSSLSHNFLVLSTHILGYYACSKLENCIVTAAVPNCEKD